MHVENMIIHSYCIRPTYSYCIAYFCCIIIVILYILIAAVWRNEVEYIYSIIIRSTYISPDTCGRADIT